MKFKVLTSIKLKNNQNKNVKSIVSFFNFDFYLIIIFQISYYTYQNPQHQRCNKKVSKLMY